MVGDTRAIQFITPLPPLRTGIAQYTRDLLNALDGRWPVRVVPERGASLDGDLQVEYVDPRHVDLEVPSVVQLGNSEFHRQGFDFALKSPGIVVLHDVVLHHGLLALALNDGRMPEYWRELWHRYGTDGYRAGKDLLRGAAVDSISYPLSEQFIEGARLTVVHNRFAERVVRQLVPGARVMRVPMGIPLPPLIDRNEARRALSLPESAFVVASISHINPNKRMPVVLRAIKRLSARLPESMFVIAGSRAPAVDIERHVRALGLRDRVIVTGYVEDQRARLIAAAADACVNLRHPPSGETSASLLRLLGAGKPVLVTDGAASEDLPADVALRVPVDRLEEEFIADLLLELAQNDGFREQAGRAARQFVESRHSMGAAVEGYRQAIATAFDFRLPALGELAISECAPKLPVGERGYRRPGYSELDRTLTSAMGELGLGGHVPLIETAARATVSLGLDRLPRTGSHGEELQGHQRDTSERLKDRMKCVRCGGALGWNHANITCTECGTNWMSEGGVPNLARAGTARAS